MAYSWKIDLVQNPSLFFFLNVNTGQPGFEHVQTLLQTD